MYSFNMDNNPLWANKQKLGDRPISSDFFNKSYGTVKYYSGIDAQIYFEGLYIEDVVQINFVMQQNTMPLFGYNSYVYDELAVGSRLINGQFTINFTQSEYMYKIIEQLSQIKEERKSKDLVYDRKRHPVLNRTFNIILNYGKNENAGYASEGSTQMYLTGVQLTGSSQQLSITGEPVYEVYSFIAQDLMPSLPSNDDKNANNASDNDDEEESDENEDYILNIKTAEYKEELDSKHQCVGKIKIELDTNLDIKAISVNPKINTENSQASKTIEVTNESVVVYTVSSELREDIKKYYNNNNISMPADFFAEYDEDGESCMTEPKTIDIQLKNIIDN